MNAKDMLDLIRDSVNEATASHYSDLNLLRRLNAAQERVAKMVVMSPGQWLVTSKIVTPVASVITLPTDCVKPIYLEDNVEEEPIPILDGGVGFRRISRGKTTSLDIGTREAYVLLNTLVVNEDSFVNACTLWYQVRVPRLHVGHADTGSGASALVLDKSLVAGTNELGTGREIQFVDDYYNGAIVEVIDDTTGLVDIRSEISDYAASTATLVITGTPAATDLYGTISRLPEELSQLINLETIINALMKPGASIDEKIIQYYSGEIRRERKMVDEFLMSRIPNKGVSIGELY